jgi:hypothetical protein
MRGWVGPSVGLDAVEKRKILTLLPVGSRYTNCTTPAHDSAGRMLNIITTNPMVMRRRWWWWWFIIEENKYLLFCHCTYRNKITN